MLRLNILFVITILFITACLKSDKDSPESDKDSPGDLETIYLCDFPSSLKNAIEQKLNMKCADVTSNHLAQIKQLRMKNVIAEELNSLDKKYTSHFASLEDVDISHNLDMKTLPSFIVYIPNLKTLNVSNTGIKSFSGEICHLKKSLTTLIAANNNYEGQEMPVEIFCLNKLKVLNMSHSSLRYMDEYIGKLLHLEELYMSGNSLFLIPQMLSTLPYLTLVDFRDNNLKNEDLNILQSCKSLFKGEKKEECQEDLLDSIACEAVHELPFQRGEPLRQIYTNLAGQSQELMKQCEDDEGQYCPPFITNCVDYPSDKEQCMLDYFESTRASNIHKLHRDKCYINWVTWLVNYEKNPELLNKTIRGKTIREIRYVGTNQSVISCWEWPWENIRTAGGWIDFAPEKYSAHPFEAFPEEFRAPGIASYIQSFSEGGGDLFWRVPDDCPHLSSNLKKQVEEIVQKYDLTREASKK